MGQMRFSYTFVAGDETRGIGLGERAEAGLENWERLAGATRGIRCAHPAAWGLATNGADRGAVVRLLLFGCHIVTSTQIAVRQLFVHCNLIPQYTILATETHIFEVVSANRALEADPDDER